MAERLTRSVIIQQPKTKMVAVGDSSSSKKGGGGKMEMGSVSKAVGFLHRIAKGEPKCG